MSQVASPFISEGSGPFGPVTTSISGQVGGKDMVTDPSGYVTNDLPPHIPYPHPHTKVVYQYDPDFDSTGNSTCHLPIDFLYICAACVYLVCCVIVACWMFNSGPKLVPLQDTRITNLIISVGAKIALGLALWIVAMRWRTQWARILVLGQRVRLGGLLSASGGDGPFMRASRIRTAPTVGVGCTAVIGMVVTILMTLTSAGFKYVNLPGTAIQEFSGPDFETVCNYSAIVTNNGGYFCTGQANAVTVTTEWNYIDLVNSGAGGNIVLSSGLTGIMSANVTLTSAPANIRLPTDPPPPWAAIDVSCRSAELMLQVHGNGSTATNAIFVDGKQLDQLSVAEMPSWNSQVQLYQQVNDTGAASSLCPWYMVLLTRDLNDGTANIGGLSGSAVNFLANAWIDLHGYGPVQQGILGAAAYCNFSGSTGGGWPSFSWPFNATTNAMVGTGPTNGTIPVSTVFLNYGPSWQYNPVSANALPGGSVTYIANWTADATNYPDFIARYMRNQWALMMYTNNFITGWVKNTSYNVKIPPQLYIQATAIIFIPVVALVLSIVCAGICLWTMLGLGFWYERVDVAPWWLLKATGWAGPEGRNATRREFEAWCKQVRCMYSANPTDTNAGSLKLVSTSGPGDLVLE